MGEYRSGSTAVTTIMLVSLVYTFLATLVLGSLAEASQYSRTIPMPGEVRAEMDALNRYCGGGRYGSSYYNRPTSSSSGGLGSLLGPAIFGLAAVGGAAAIASALGITVGK